MSKEPEQWAEEIRNKALSQIEADKKAFDSPPPIYKRAMQSLADTSEMKANESAFDSLWKQHRRKQAITSHTMSLINPTSRKKRIRQNRLQKLRGLKMTVIDEVTEKMKE